MGRGIKRSTTVLLFLVIKEIDNKNIFHPSLLHSLVIIEKDDAAVDADMVMPADKSVM